MDWFLYDKDLRRERVDISLIGFVLIHFVSMLPLISLLSSILQHPLFHFCNPWKRQKTFGFVTFQMV